VKRLGLALGLVGAIALGIAVVGVTAGDTDVSFEQEPNDAVPQELDMGSGARPGAPVSFRIKGTIGARGDVDRFSLELNAGDVVGASVSDTSGLDPLLRLVNADGDLVVANDRKVFGLHQMKWWSALPRPDEGWGGDSFLAAVIAVPGEYVLEVSGEDGSDGRYRLDVLVARPGMEAQPKGARQIVFVDFDGAKVNMGRLSGGGSGTKVLSPMADFLGAWGLTSADEDDVIDAVLATLEEMLSSDIRANGLNGDHAQSGVDGEFDIEIRNSRDDEDTYGTDPLVTRLVIGGTRAQAGIPYFAASSGEDPGNFTTDDDTLVLLDELAGLTTGNVNRDLNRFGVAAGHTKAELVGRALGRAGAHELGHVFGCWHTEFTNHVFNVMDRGALGGPNGFDPAGTGADGILGTSDDVDYRFGVDAYSSFEGVFRGVHDTLNTISFGLATGRR
jgi:hypothetical protein